MNNVNHIKKLKKVIFIISVSLLGFVLLMSATFYIMGESGKNKLFKAQNEEQLEQLRLAMEQGPVLEKDSKDTEFKNTEDTNTEITNVEKDKADTIEDEKIIKETEVTETAKKSEVIKITYNNKTYQYNEDVMTFLFMGIDQRGEVALAKDGISGGQSDTMFLLVLNPHTKLISMVGINRDTIADIDMYDKSGNFLMTDKRQITLQHGYGDGMHQSCQRSVNAVSKLFYYIPINGYCSINLDAITNLNDAVGGVEVVTPNKVEINGVTYEAGKSINLQGKAAERFLQKRDIYSFNSAGERLERQKTYLGAFVKKAIEKTKKNLSFPLEVYDIISKYMVTNVSVDSILYMATEAAGFNFSETQIYSLQGKTILGNKFEEFYPDQEALYDLVIRLFYEEITE